MSIFHTLAYWFKDQSDVTHHAFMFGGTAAGIALLRKASPAALAATSITAIGAQFGTQAWIGTFAGPTMLLNLKDRNEFGDVQARLFPKMGMVCTSTSLLALAAYHFAHPTPDKLTRILMTLTASHHVLAFILIPITTYYQYERRKYAVEDPEYKKNAMMFSISHAASMFCSYATMSMGAFYIYSIAKRVAHVW